MRDGRRRALVLAVLTAVAVGFGLGWLARMWSRPAPEDRVHQRMEQIRERAREVTR